MSFLTQFLTVAGIHILAAMSPGPDFVMIMRQAVMYSRRAGVYSALGLGLGILVHVAYSLAGLGFIIAESLLLFSIMKFAGAAYLIYLGYKSLQATPLTRLNESIEKGTGVNSVSAIKIGFLTNVTNPKVTLFFLSLFTIVIEPATPLWIQILYGIEMAVATVLWFTIVALFFSSTSLKNRLRRAQIYIRRLTGAVLIFFGIKLALSSASK